MNDRLYFGELTNFSAFENCTCVYSGVLSKENNIFIVLYVQLGKKCCKSKENAVIEINNSFSCQHFGETALSVKVVEYDFKILWKYSFSIVNEYLTSSPIKRWKCINIKFKKYMNVDHVTSKQLIHFLNFEVSLVS